jgi:hypothetical protein
MADPPQDPNQQPDDQPAAYDVPYIAGQADPTQPQSPAQPGYPPPFQTIAPAQRPRRSVPLIVAVFIAAGAGVVFCLGGVLVGAASTQSAKPQISYAPSPYPVVSVSTVTVTKTVAVTPSPPPPPPGPATTLENDGVYLVGSDIAPGTYRAKVTSNNCYWARLKSTNPQDIISNDNVSSGGQALVTISASDKAFQTDGCGKWTKVG